MRSLQMAKCGALGGEHCPSPPGAHLGVTSHSYTATGSGRYEGATGAGIYQEINAFQNPDFSSTDTA